MYTEIIVISLLSFFGGVIFGKFFRKLNPFMMVVGTLLFAGMIQWLVIEDNWLYQFIFIGGVLINFKPIIRWINKIMKKVQSGFHGNWRKLLKKHSTRRKTGKKATDEAKKERQARILAEQEVADLKVKLMAQMEKLKNVKQSAGLAMPTTFSEACDVFGLAGHVTLEKFKSVRLKLLQQYHEDKCQHLGERLQQQAKIETQRINMAWEIVERQFRK